MHNTAENIAIANGTIGRVLSIAVRSARRGDMREIAQAKAVKGGGIAGDIKSVPDRGITLLASVQWLQATQQLQVDLPWHTRRANVLIEAERLDDLVGRTIRIGDVQIEIVGESKPCGLMDWLHKGLREALQPDGRGGVYGRVVRDGTFKVGDAVELLP